MAGEGILKESEVREIWEELGHNKYIMSQVSERCMRQYIIKGLGNSKVFEEAAKMYVELKVESEDQTVFDLFVSEYRTREA